MINEKFELTTYETMPIDLIRDKTKWDISHVLTYLQKNIVNDLRDRSNPPVNLGRIAEAAFCESSKLIEMLVYDAECQEDESFLNINGHMVKNAFRALVQNKIHEELKRDILFQIYLNSMLGVSLTLGLYLDASLICPILGFEDRSKEYRSKWKDLANQKKFLEPVSEPLYDHLEKFQTSENIAKARSIYANYVEEFRKSDLYNFDVEGYLEDQKSQWIKYRENQEKIKRGEE